MDRILNISEIQQNLIEIQDILFKKGTKEEAFNHLSKSNIKFNDLIATLVVDEDEKKIDLLVSLFELLKKFEGFKDDLVILLFQKHIKTKKIYSLLSQ